MTVLFQNRPLDAAIDQLARMGVQAVEIGAGSYPGNAQCNPTELLKGPGVVRAFSKNVEDRGLIISGLSCHANPLFPNKAFAAASDRFYRETVRLASEMGVGYGHDQFTWRSFVSALRLTGYDYVLSIEHEALLASIDEGLGKAVAFLKDVLLYEQPSTMWRA
jgi:sugar phosphate isomerase/epimerase